MNDLLNKRKIIDFNDDGSKLITTRKNSNTTRIENNLSNKDKIMAHFNNDPTPIATSDLAKATGISLSNISRYVNTLVKERKLEKETFQEGKKRFIIVKLITTRKENATSRNDSKKLLKSRLLIKKQRLMKKLVALCCLKKKMIFLQILFLILL